MTWQRGSIVIIIMEGLADALASGDTDALRLRLQQLSSPASNPPPPNEEDEAPDPVQGLVEKAGIIADDILARGLPHLEREAAAARTARTAAALAASTDQLMLEIPELGLKLQSTKVMSQPVWPAALALGRWLRRRANEVCNGARCIELGAGGGAPGLVARAAGAAELVATEGDESLLPLLRANCAANPGGPWTAAALDWCDLEAVRAAAGNSAGGGPVGFDLVLAADCLYSVGDIQPLVRAAVALMRRRPRSRFLLARSAWFEDLQPTCVACAEEMGLSLLSSERVQSVGGGTDSAAAAAGADSEHVDAVVLEFVFISPISS